DVFRDRGDVRPQREDLRPGGHDVVRRDVVAKTKEDLAFDRVFWRRGDGERRDVGAANNMDRGSVLRRPFETRRIDGILRGLLRGRIFAELPWIRDDSVNRRRCRGLGTTQVDEVVRGSAPPLDVSVERPDRGP